MKLLVVVVMLVACRKPSDSAAGGAVAIETYRPAHGEVIALSATGNTALVRTSDDRSSYGKLDDLQLIDRRTGKVLGATQAVAVGSPDDTEAYGLVGNRLIAFTTKRGLALDLPVLETSLRWHLAWSTIDHSSGTALLVFDEKRDVGAQETDEARDRNDSRYELVEVDVRAMSLRGRSTISILGSKMTADEVASAIVAAETNNKTTTRTYGSSRRGCDLAAHGSQLYVTCRVPEIEGKVEHWVATRYDGRRLVWSVQLETPPDLGGGDITTGVGGDGKTLLVVHGDRKSGLLEGKTTILVDTATGKSRSMASPEHPLGKIADLTSLPGTPLVMQVHRFEPSAHGWGERSFHGISVVDTTTGQSRVVFDTSETHKELRHDTPRAVMRLPNGSYLLAL